MIPSAIRRHSSSRGPRRARWCILLLAALAPIALARAQSSEIDWHSTLILHFDPAVPAPSEDDGDLYLARIADGLESGWISEAGAGVVSVGPLFVQAQESGYDYGRLDPSLGVSADWIRLVSAARQRNIAVAVRLHRPSPAGNYSKLAEWASRTGIRHFILEGPAISDVTLLRAALDAATSGTSWIAASYGVGSNAGASGANDIAAASDTGNMAGTPGANDIEASSGAGDIEATPGADDIAGASGAVDRAVQSGGRAHTGDRAEASLFDARIETVAPGRLTEDAPLDSLYAAFAQRLDVSRQPLVSSVQGAPDHLVTRMLMLPGAVQMPADAVRPDASDHWRRIAAFRASHPAVGRGEHIALVNNAFTFARISHDADAEDRVIVVLGASGATTVNVSRIFPDNALLQDALTGRTAFVSFGMATFDAGPSGIILIEEAL